MQLIKNVGFKQFAYTLIAGSFLIAASAKTFAQSNKQEAVQTKSFTYSGAVQTFVVPEGVTALQVEVAGASGGKSFSKANAYGHPGLGGKVQATISVMSGQILSILVGGAGTNGNANEAGKGGYNGGANGGIIEGEYAGGGAGGASDIRLQSGSLQERLIVAGGGGAAGKYGAGGNGGGLQGADGYGEGVTAMGGSQKKGGLSGSYYTTYFAQNGSLGKGGASSAGDNGGGGGGGWYGGGGGAFGDGGGGSSYASSATTEITHTQGSNEGNGYVIVKWKKNTAAKLMVANSTSQTTALKIYPNPTSGEFNMQLQNKRPCLAEIRLQLSNGATFLRRTFPVEKANAVIRYSIPGKVPGIYFITISTPEGQQTGRVVVQ